MRAEQRDDGRRVRAVTIHAHAERLEPAQHEVAVERRRHRADRVLQEPQLVGPLVVVERDEAADDVGVTAEVLRRRVHDDVGALAAAAAGGTASRTCCRRRRARRARARTRRSRRCRRPSSIGFVGVSIHTMRVVSRHTAVERVGLAEVGGAPREPGRRVHLRDEPERAAVRVVRDDDVIAGPQQPQHRVLGREAAREREPVRRALERGEARLVRAARRVVAARVLEAAVLADLVLRERRREADRRDDRAGHRIGRLPGVDRAGLEPELPVGRLAHDASDGAIAEEREHVAAGQHRARAAAVEHDDRRALVEQLDDARDRLADADRRQRRALHLARPGGRAPTDPARSGA